MPQIEREEFVVNDADFNAHETFVVGVDGSSGECAGKAIDACKARGKGHRIERTTYYHPTDEWYWPENGPL